MLSICKGGTKRCAHPTFLGLKAAKIPHFWCQSLNKSDSIFLALRSSENLNFIIFRIQIALALFMLICNINLFL